MDFLRVKKKIIFWKIIFILRNILVIYVENLEKL